jgi:hypothetical protein
MRVRPRQAQPLCVPRSPPPARSPHPTRVLRLASATAHPPLAPYPSSAPHRLSAQRGPSAACRFSVRCSSSAAYRSSAPSLASATDLTGERVARSSTQLRRPATPPASAPGRSTRFPRSADRSSSQTRTRRFPTRGGSGRCNPTRFGHHPHGGCSHRSWAGCRRCRCRMPVVSRRAASRSRTAVWASLRRAGPARGGPLRAARSRTVGSDPSPIPSRPSMPLRSLSGGTALGRSVRRRGARRTAPMSAGRSVANQRTPGSPPSSASRSGVAPRNRSAGSDLAWPGG